MHYFHYINIPCRDKTAPSVSKRQVCYDARDAFYKCVVENNSSEDPCIQLKKEYHKNCLQSWVCCPPTLATGS